MDAESDDTDEEGCNFFTFDSELEFAVLAVEGLHRPTNQVPSSTASAKKLEVINAATCKIRCIQITLRCNQTLFKATVYTGSPASFVNKRTAEFLIKQATSAVVLDKTECPIDTVYVDFIRKKIKGFGTLIIDVSSLNWNVKSVKFLVPENRTRCLLGLDLQSQLGVRTTQVRPPSPLLGIISQSEPS